MNPITIQSFINPAGYILIPFTRRQCAALSQACWIAGQESLDPAGETWSLWAALFHTCAASEPPVGKLAPPDLLPPDLAMVTWQGEWIILKLSLGHCAGLARGCWFATQHALEEEPDEEVGNWANLAEMLRAYVVAGLSQGQLDQAGLEEVAAGLRLLGLGVRPEMNSPGY